MARTSPKRILFTGYAPVHCVCFRPIYERLRKLPGLTIHLSGDKNKEGAEERIPTAADL